MQSLTKETLKIFWQHTKKYPWQAAGVFVGILVATAFVTYIPLLYRDLLNMLTEPAVKTDITPAIHLVVFILVMNFLKVALWRAANFVNNYFQPKVMSDLTSTCYQYLQKHSYNFFSSKFVGSLVTRVKRFERSFEVIADQITFDLGRALIDTFMILGILLWQYPMFGLMLLTWCILFLIFSYFFALYKLPYDIKRAKADTHTTAQLADSITNNVNIKAFSSYDTENKRFDNVTDKQFRLRKKSWDLGTIGEIVQGTSMIALEFLIIYFAIKFWQDGRLNIGDVSLLLAYFIRIVDKLWNTGKNIRNIYEAIADANEMTEMLLQPHAVDDLPGAIVMATPKGKVEFKNVSFGYHTADSIFNNFNLTIKPGERVALVGSSGGGKSTILKLLMRFYDVTGGAVLIDDLNIATVTQDSLRDAISFVPQDPILFHRPLADNIRYGKPDASDEEVIRVAKLAHAHEFIEKSENGYQTMVGERGIKLSGGERQRIAIARAILKDAPILILDEATSSLDSESEMLIQDALKNLMKGRTTIVVAHRLSTIMQMDRIVVIARGEIIEEGKHEDLLKEHEGMYQKLWRIQAGGFAEA